MTATTPDETLVLNEYALFRRSPAWELTQIHRALNLMPYLNGPVEIARLEAVRRIRAERRAAAR